ncbi:MAG: ABC transporter permease subunit [Acidobacteriia bacterium]|nr:ABC transporter permease subunit [Terriglobia bacterium]
MLRNIIAKELRECIYSYRSLLIFVLSAGLFATAIYAGAREFQTALEEYRLADAAQRQHAAEQTNLFTLANFGFDLVKPPQVLSIFVSGVEPHTPRVYNLSLFTLPEPRGSTSSASPISALFGTLDLAFIVQVVLGLAALLFTFSAVCGEKETGTLKLQLAHALPKDVLLLGKLIGNLVGLLVPVALAFLLSCFLLPVLDGVTLTGEDVSRIMLLGVDFLLYLAVLFALGIFVSTLTTRATTAFSLCLVVWVVLVAIVPKLAVLAARRLSPVESLQEFELRKVEIHRQGSIEAQREYSGYSKEHHNETPPVSVYFDVVGRVRQKQNQELKQLEDEYRRQMQLQQRWALRLSRLSPAGSMENAAMSLARTGLERDQRFQNALRDYRSEFTRYYDRKGLELVALTQDGRISTSAVNQDLTDLPNFQFHEEPFGASLDAALPDMSFLVIWSMALFVAAYFTFLRYDVR